MSYRMTRIYFTLLILQLTILSSMANSPKRMSRQEYIDKFAPLAIEEMNEYHIPASITLAQACLESADGNSELSRKSNNHFGIKCNNGWNGPSVRHDDDERNECFRKYSDPLESFRDHSRYLVNGMRYQFLFDYNISDYKKWANGLKRAGYATDPAYPAKLIKIIEDFRLDELDSYYRSGKLLTSHSKTHPSRHTAKNTAKKDNFSIDPYSSRAIERRNGSNAFTAKKGDTYEAIAREFGMKEWEILKYNDARKGERPEPNAPVYIQHKRLKAPRGNDFHVAQQGETMQSIAQWYGIRLSALYSKNNMREGEQPRPGQHISLRRKLK